MSLFESLLELRYEPLTIACYDWDSKIYKLLHSYRPENDYYRYESDNLLVMCCRRCYSNIYVIKNHGLVVVIHAYDYYSHDYIALRYNPSMDSVLTKESLLGIYGVTLVKSFKERINDILTFNDFLPKSLKSARNQPQLQL